MKRFLIAICLALVICPALQAQNVTKQEISNAVKYLEATEAGVMAATKGLSEAQWNFKQASNRWSVAEVTEHIAAAEDFLMNMITNQVMSAPARANGADIEAIDALVLKMVPDRSKKVQAPEPLVPDNRFGSPAASLKHFTASRADTIRFVKKTKNMRGHAIDSPLGSQLDAYEWVLLIAAHSERHTKQIDEVKADPNFPKQ